MGDGQQACPHGLYHLTLVCTWLFGQGWYPGELPRFASPAIDWGLLLVCLALLLDLSKVEELKGDAGNAFVKEKVSSRATNLIPTACPQHGPPQLLEAQARGSCTLRLHAQCRM
jgi:hypothetical protein